MFSLTLVLLLAPLGLIVLLAGYALWYQWRHRPRLTMRGPLRHHVPLTGDGLRLFATGDTGTGQPPQMEVAAAMAARCATHPADGLLLLGDIFYMRGIAGLDDPLWQTRLEEPYGQGALGSVPIYPVLGNHDYRGDLQAMLDHSTRSPRWHMPNRFYSVTFGDVVKLIAFDTGFTDVWFREDGGALDFLLRELKKPTEARWVVVMGHTPLAAASPRGWSYSGFYFGRFMRWLVGRRAHLWLNAHAHHLEHRPLPGEGLHCFISGAGGGRLHSVRNDPRSSYVRSEGGFLELHFTREAIEARFILADGRVDYETRLDSASFGGR